MRRGVGGAAARGVALLAISAFALGCDRPPVAWQAPVRTAGAPSPGWHLALDAAGSPQIVGRPTVSFVAPPGACPGSLAFTSLGGGDWYAAWWQPRADSSAALVVARSVNGGESWAAPVVADARDHSSFGCARPGPALVGDSASGYVHVVYFLAAAQGTGIWFTHSMEHGAIWHAPVGVLFGDDRARADMAAHGDTVVVAYEYPNADEARVGIAISYSAGHIFEARMPVSSTTEAAGDPRVAVRGRRVAVGWASRPPNENGDTAATATVLDVGQLGSHP